MTNAILKMKMKAIVITHKQRIKEQWIKTILEMTSVDETQICDISGSEVIDAIMKGKINADIYYVNHQTINAYARIHGWTSIRDFFKKIKVGVKVVDEAHKFFENSLMIDYFSNVKRSYYLTATFTRSDPKEVRIFKTAYSSVYRFGEETMNYEEKRKHIVFVVVYYHSNPTIEERNKISTSYGFSSYRYIDYALNEEGNTMMKVLHRLIDQTDRLEGKTLVISPKVDSVNCIAEQIKKYTTKSVGTVHSRNTVAQNERGYDSDIISSTIKSIGEGDDIKGLRAVINLEPIGSKALADQLRGRLREYSDDDDTFMFYPVDTAIKESYEFLKRIMPVMKKKCKEIIIMTMDDV
jgi:superfamily II DNA or RNA helicase